MYVRVFVVGFYLHWPKRNVLILGFPLNTLIGYVPPYTSNSKYYDLIDGKVVTTSVHPGGSTDRNPVLQHLDQVGNMGQVGDVQVWTGSPAAPGPGGEYMDSPAFSFIHYILIVFLALPFSFSVSPAPEKGHDGVAPSLGWWRRRGRGNQRRLDGSRGEPVPPGWRRRYRRRQQHVSACEWWHFPVWPPTPVPVIYAPSFLLPL